MMKSLFVYDDPEVTGQLIKGVPSIYVYTIDEKGEKKKLYDIAIEIKQKAEKESIVFIDQYLACADEGFGWLQRNAGIALIKFLRMLEVRNHIVLITPFTGREMKLIEMNPANLIVASKGISFAKSIKEAELTAHTKETFDDKQDLKPYILAEFRLPENERHNWANWWGIDRLWQTYAIINSVGKEDLERTAANNYPPSLIATTKEFRNFQALFLYGHTGTSFLLQILEAKHRVDILERVLCSIDKLRKERIDEQNGYKEQILKAKEALAELNEISHKSGLYDREINDILDYKYMYPKSIEEHQKLIVNIENILNQLWNDSIQNSRAKNFNKKQLEIALKEFAVLKERISPVTDKILFYQKQLNERKPKILYIDDQANDGWSDIFRHIIYNELVSTDVFKVIQPEVKEVIEGRLGEKVLKEINSFIPDVILLDLRLKKEGGVRANTEILSGAILLKEIRAKFSGIPILMTTASNKSWSYEKLQQLGCDAFWTKEGIDTAMSETDSAQNHLRFVELVSLLSGEEYLFLKDYFNQVEKLEKKKTHWWRDENRFKKDTLKAIDGCLVFDVLKETATIYKEFLRANVMKQINTSVYQEWFYASLIIQHLGKIVEKLHYGGAEVSAKIMEYRGDICGKQLFLKRHNASHIELTPNLKQKDAKEYMKAILDYLNDRDCCPKSGLKVVGKIKL